MDIHSTPHPYRGTLGEVLTDGRTCRQKGQEKERQGVGGTKVFVFDKIRSRHFKTVLISILLTNYGLKKLGLEEFEKLGHLQMD
jgi:hypothetical protein